MMTSYDITREPVIIEESMAAMADRKYTLIVQINTNKVQVKKAAGEIFGAKAEKVQTMRTIGKTKRMDVHVGKRADLKKAAITLTTDSRNTEFFEGV